VVGGRGKRGLEAGVGEIVYGEGRFFELGECEGGLWGIGKGQGTAGGGVCEAEISGGSEKGRCGKVEGVGTDDAGGECGRQVV